jgi:predicted TPR repeat methyltransferase
MAAAAGPSEVLFRQAMDALAAQQRGRAVAAFRRLLKLTPDHLDGHFLLGTTLAEGGDFAGALPHLRRATELSPHSARVWNNLATLQRLLGHWPEAIRGYLRALACEPDHREAGANLAAVLAATEAQGIALAAPMLAQAWLALGQFHAYAGEREAALAAYRRAGTLLPAGHPDLAFRIAALFGQPAPRRAAADVARDFDAYAAVFDAHLAGHLDYRLPEQIAERLDRLDGGTRRRARALDLGCGTGLSGQAIRARVERLVGVDVSPGMLALAEKRGIYDELRCADLHAYLGDGTECFDLVIAADVAPYVGRLDDLLAALTPRLLPDALVWLSVEHHAGPEDYLVGAGSRYAHSPAHVERAALGYEMALAEEIPLRREGDAYCPGMLYALRRPA